MWIAVVTIAGVSLPMVLPMPRVAFPTEQACRDFLGTLPNSRAWAQRHGGDLDCVSFRIIGEQRI